MAIQKGVKLVTDSDAHISVHFAFLKIGIGQAIVFVSTVFLFKSV